MGYIALGKLVKLKSLNKFLYNRKIRHLYCSFLHTIINKYLI